MITDKKSSGAINVIDIPVIVFSRFVSNNWKIWPRVRENGYLGNSGRRFQRFRLRYSLQVVAIYTLVSWQDPDEGVSGRMERGMSVSGPFLAMTVLRLTPWGYLGMLEQRSTWKVSPFLSQIFSSFLLCTLLLL